MISRLWALRAPHVVFPVAPGTRLATSRDHAGEPPALTVLFVAHAQDDFGRPVIARHHVRRHHEVGACCPGQAKVKDLKRAV